MVQRIKSKIGRFILSFISAEDIELKMRQNLVNRNSNCCEADKSVRISFKARIINSSNSKSRISIFGKTIIDGELLVFPYGGKITIGDGTYVGPESRLWSGEEIKVGNNVLISHMVHISDTSAHEPEHDIRAERFRELYNNGLPKTKSTIKTAPIIIEDNVWINNHVIITRGVTIGKGSIIAAGSVVTKSIPPFSFAVGNPAKVIKQVS